MERPGPGLEWKDEEESFFGRSQSVFTIKSYSIEEARAELLSFLHQHLGSLIENRIFFLIGEKDEKKLLSRLPPGTIKKKTLRKCGRR